MKRNPIILLISSIVLIILLAGSMYIVKEGEYKVVLRFGEAMRTVEEPGLKFKIPFIENVSELPKYQMTYESTPTNILTKDQKPIVVDNYTVWRITNASQFLRTVQTVSGECSVLMRRYITRYAVSCRRSTMRILSVRIPDGAILTMRSPKT